MGRRYEVKSPAVASEIIDGEAVIMHLKSGNYYSAAGSGGVIWQCIENRLPVARMVDTLLAHYAISPAEAASAVETFIAELLAQDLIREAEGGGAESAAGTPEPVSGGRSFSAPVLNVYSDMQDLLLLDPIHDVDEVGWPTPADSTRI